MERLSDFVASESSLLDPLPSSERSGSPIMDGPERPRSLSPSFPARAPSVSDMADSLAESNWGQQTALNPSSPPRSLPHSDTNVVLTKEQFRVLSQAASLSSPSPTESLAEPAMVRSHRTPSLPLDLEIGNTPYHHSPPPMQEVDLPTRVVPGQGFVGEVVPLPLHSQGNMVSLDTRVVGAGGTLHGAISSTGGDRISGISTG
jgi:hypothetical protein